MSEQKIFAKCAWRLMPFLVAGYFVNFLDRTNVGFASLTMNKDLGFSPSVFGFGAGILFISYGLFQLPANVILYRVGARRWLSFILTAWGALSALNASTRDATTFYTLRFLLGAAEAGFQPGVLKWTLEMGPWA